MIIMVESKMTAARPIDVVDIILDHIAGVSVGTAVVSPLHPDPGDDRE